MNCKLCGVTIDEEQVVCPTCQEMLFAEHVAGSSHITVNRDVESFRGTSLSYKLGEMGYEEFADFSKSPVQALNVCHNRVVVRKLRKDVFQVERVDFNFYEICDKEDYMPVDIGSASTTPRKFAFVGSSLAGSISILVPDVAEVIRTGSFEKIVKGIDILITKHLRGWRIDKACKGRINVSKLIGTDLSLEEV